MDKTLTKWEQHLAEVNIAGGIPEDEARGFTGSLEKDYGKPNHLETNIQRLLYLYAHGIAHSADWTDIEAARAKARSILQAEGVSTIMLNSAQMKILLEERAIQKLQ